MLSGCSAQLPLLAMDPSEMEARVVSISWGGDLSEPETCQLTGPSESQARRVHVRFDSVDGCGDDVTRLAGFWRSLSPS